MYWQVSWAVSQSSGSTNGKPTTKKPSSLTWGSGRPSMPLSRMHWVHSTSVSNAACSSADSSGAEVVVVAVALSSEPSSLLQATSSPARVNAASRDE